MPETLEQREPRSVSQSLKSSDSNSLDSKQIAEFGWILWQKVSGMSDDDVKKNFIALIDKSWLTDDVLLEKMHEWIMNAVYEWPKWTILTDRKTITSIVKLVFQMKGKLKDNSQIQIVNAFGNTNITL